MTLDMTCRCKDDYTCVACKVKRGDYRDWMDVTCSAPDCDDKIRSQGMCLKHHARWAGRPRRIA